MPVSRNSDLYLIYVTWELQAGGGSRGVAGEGHRHTRGRAAGGPGRGDRPGRREGLGGGGGQDRCQESGDGGGVRGTQADRALRHHLRGPERASGERRGGVRDNCSEDPAFVTGSGGGAEGHVRSGQVLTVSSHISCFTMTSLCIILQILEIHIF